MGNLSDSYAGPLAVVFDMDGVLVASEAEWERAFAQIVAERGLELSREARLDLYGCSDEHENEVLSGILGVSEEEAARIKVAYVEAHPIDYASIEIPGVAEALRRLRELGLKCAIATSSPAVDAARMVRECGIAGCFDAIVTCDDVHAAKPDPALYLLAAERLGVAPARCVAVDDSRYGVEAATRAGMHAIHFSRDERTPDASDLAHDVCASHEEAVAVIEALVSEGSM